MSSIKDRQRAAARARLEKEMAERATAARKRRQRQAIIGSALAVVVIAGAAVWIVAALGNDDDKKSTDAAAPPPGTVACTWIPEDGSSGTLSLKLVREQKVLLGIDRPALELDLVTEQSARVRFAGTAGQKVTILTSGSNFTGKCGHSDWAWFIPTRRVPDLRAGWQADQLDVGQGWHSRNRSRTGADT